MIYIWLGILVFSLCLEAATTALIATWFAVGAFGAMITSLITENITIQIMVFVVISAVLLMLYVCVWRKKFTRKRVPTNTDAIIGTVCLVEQTIPVDGRGRVKAGAQSWSAVSVDNSEIPEGSAVEVLAIEGVKLVCAKTEKQVFTTQK